MSRHPHDFETDPREEKPSLAELRQRLAVLCALDRVQLRLVLAPPPRTAAQASHLASEGFKTVFEATRFLPGKLGVWSRRVGLAASLVRLLR